MMKRRISFLLLLTCAFLCITAPANSFDGDIDGDLDFDLTDWGKFSLQWLNTACAGCGGADFSGDNNVDEVDLSLAAINWMTNLNPPQAHLLLDGDAFDSSPYGHHAAFIGGPFFAPDSERATVLEFDGIDDKVQLTGYKGVVGTTSRTVTAWIKVPSGFTGNGTVVSWGNWVCNEKWFIQVQDTQGTPGSLKVANFCANATGSTDLRDDQWHHIAAVLYDDGTPDISEVIIYVDGIPETLTISAPAPVGTVSADDVTIGCRLNGSTYDAYFRGQINDLRIYDRPLTMTEVADLMLPVPLPVPGTLIEPSDPLMQYTGRIIFNDPNAPKLGWSGASVTANFQGTSLRAVLEDYTDNYFTVVIDDGNPKALACLSGENTYVLAAGLTDTTHKVELMKRTEGSDGNVFFKGFLLDAGKTLVSPPPRPTRRIEYYGDSITAGMGVDYTGSGDDQTNPYTNSYLTYAAITARTLNAEAHYIAVSGIGIYKSWFAGNMPNNYYYRTNPANGSVFWDFAQWTPDVVVINLGQNDKWLGTTQTQAQDGYVNFVLNIRVEYPDAEIIFALGNMDATAAGSPWPGYIANAVNTLQTTHGETKIHSIMFPYLAIGAHPHLPQQQAMADDLTPFIQAITGW